jgi:hypothetical protein
MNDSETNLQHLTSFWKPATSTFPSHWLSKSTDHSAPVAALPNQTIGTILKSCDSGPHFPDTQTRLFHRLHDVFHPASEPPLRLFDPVIHLEVLGPKLCDRPLASEADLQQYERPAVEQPVTSVISALRDRSADSIFNIGNGIIFESHPNTLSDMSEEVQQRQQQRRQRWQAGGQSADTNMRPKNTDQICVYKDTHGRITAQVGVWQISLSNLLS